VGVVGRADQREDEVAALVLVPAAGAVSGYTQYAYTWESTAYTWVSTAYTWVSIAYTRVSIANTWVSIAYTWVSTAYTWVSMAYTWVSTTTCCHQPARLSAVQAWVTTLLTRRRSPRPPSAHQRASLPTEQCPATVCSSGGQLEKWCVCVRARGGV
jgi:hypothetical protein